MFVTSQKSFIRNISPLMIACILLIEGFVSIAIEIITIRQLLPVAGGSVIVTSLVIGVFLLFLALGYHKGGCVTNDYKESLNKNFLLASWWLGIGLSYAFIIYFFYLIQRIIGHNLFYPLIAYLLLIIAPLIYILGQTVPITMNLMRTQYSAAKLGGNSLSVSTIGSFLGATITAVILMHYWGVAWTVFSNFILLLSLSLLLTKDRKTFFSELLLATFGVLVIYYLNIALEKNLFILTDNYANYQLLNEKNYSLTADEKILSINNSLSSYTNQNKKGFEYIERIKKIIFDDLKLRNSNILVIGAGGFSLSAERMYNNQITYVDIDDQIDKVAVPHFIPKINGYFIADDARHFLQTTHQFYDAIVVDAYSNIRTIPAHLLTLQYMIEIKRKLTANGTVIFNIIALPTLSDPYSKHIDNTIRSVFHNCMATPEHYGNDPSNILYICNNTNNQNEKTIYTDNLNNATMDSFHW